VVNSPDGNWRLKLRDGTRDVHRASSIVQDLHSNCTKPFPCLRWTNEGLSLTPVADFKTFCSVIVGKLAREVSSGFICAGLRKKQDVGPSGYEARS
jgi:hypothetical protein